jgi:hypothetical protein
MNFFLWLASRTNCEPKDQFFSVLIRLFSTPDWRMSFSKRDSNLVASLRALALRLHSELPAHPMIIISDNFPELLDA